MTTASDEYLVPDVYVTRADDQWRVTLNPENDPGLRLNRYYIDLLRKSGGKDAEYLQGRLQEARWLMSSIELRNQTLLRVSQCIVDYQQDFLEQGELAMQAAGAEGRRGADRRTRIHGVPGDHAQVHADPPRPVRIEVLLFQPRADGAWRHDQRDSRKGPAADAAGQGAHGSPLSDQELSDLLRQTGIIAARRTVAKYRESLGIGSSNERRRLYRRRGARY